VSFRAWERPDAKLRQARHRAPVASSPRHRVVHGGPRTRSQSISRGPSPHVFLLENNSKLNNPRHFAERPLYLLNIKPWSATFRTEPQKFENNSRLTLATFQKLQIGPCNFFCHIFATLTPISSYAFIEHMFVAFIYCLCLLHVR
jgi:hypothetical protein